MLDSNAQHCGRCERSCTNGKSCVEGVCRLVCKEDRLLCGERCVDTTKDAQHCGGCGLRCSSKVCREGRCVLHADTIFALDLTATCSVVSGQLKCWGYNTDGRLGYAYRNTIRSPLDDFVPLGGQAVKQIDSMGAVQGETCALLQNGTLLCWKYDPENYTQFAKQKIEFSRKVQQIDGTNSHTCTLLEGGDVKCWGLGMDGQLGYGTFHSRDKLEKGFVDLQGKKSKQVVVGSSSTCVLLEGGAVNCWGDNRRGQLGYGDFTKRNKPSSQDVELHGYKAIQLGMGNQFVCALLDKGNVKCWGSNIYGQLGLGMKISTSSKLSKPSTQNIDFQGKQVQRISASLSHVCAVLEDGGLNCWGQNNNGQLGHTDNLNRNKPEANPLDLGGARVRQVSCGYNHT
ncbi:MAG: hypothetical protein AAGJ35_02435, partial [Myxococcota bacterium]